MAKYWRVAEAAEALGRARLRDVGDWIEVHYPGDPISDLRANLEHLTVNSPSRPHYDAARQDWRTDSGHARDRLFKIVEPGPPKRTFYLPFNPAEHGHVDLRKGSDGKWHVVKLDLDPQAQADIQGQAEAFTNQPPIDGDHDARVRLMRAVHMRRGQPLFRSRLMDAYDNRCAITGCSAIEVLEAAHILPYRGDHTNRIDNGLLLRADLHTLFDCLLLWILPDNTVDLAPSLLTTEYASLTGKSLTLPNASEHRPNPQHLAAHAARCIAHAQSRNA